MSRYIREPLDVERMGNIGFGIALKKYGWASVAEACLSVLLINQKPD
jgi:hypothetical protein